jgi:hypothetical protein
MQKTNDASMQKSQQNAALEAQPNLDLSKSPISLTIYVNCGVGSFCLDQNI